VPRQTKYRLPVSRKGRGSPFYWLAALMLLVIVGWVWWQAGETKLSESPRKPAPAVPTTKPAFAKKPLLVRPQSNVITRPLTSPLPAKVIAPTPPPQTAVFPRPVRDVFEAQLALARGAISSGSLDGVLGSQTRAALVAFQRRAGLSETGELDPDTRAHLILIAPPLTVHVVTSNDLARLQPLSKTWLGKSQQSALDYETILELVAEKGRASPNFVRRLNPTIDWTNIVTGTEVQIPDAVYSPPAAKAGFAVIGLAEKTLEVFDAKTNLLAHFPCSIAARVEKRPVGELHVSAIAPNPDYTFNPEVFPESPEAQQIKTKLILPPGPNNPVGVAWISLDLPGYGIHGTPSPEQVGRTESHGCFRLANWNAEYLLKLVWVGMPVFVEP
jgi:lipoprotein-anchoring transpeptidase ErfK/SrfK